MSRRVETEPDILASDKPLLRQEALTPGVCTGAVSRYTAPLRAKTCAYTPARGRRSGAILVKAEDLRDIVGEDWVIYNNV